MRTNRSSNRWFSRAIAVMAGAILASSFSIALAAPATQPTGEEVIAKNIEASGGKDALEKVKTRIAHGKIEVPAQGISGTIDLWYKAPNMICVDVDIPGAEHSTKVYDGKHAWEVSAMRGTRVLKGAELDEIEQQASAENETDWHKTYKSVVNNGIVEMDGKSCYKLTLEPKKKTKPEIHYYDTQTNLLVATEADTEMMSTPVHVMSTVSDYRDTDGVKIPYVTSMMMSVNGMQIEQKLTFDKIETNVEVPAAKFAIPDDVKKLMDKPEEKPAAPGK